MGLAKEIYLSDTVTFGRQKMFCNGLWEARIFSEFKTEILEDSESRFHYVINTMEHVLDENFIPDANLCSHKGDPYVNRQNIPTQHTIGCPILTLECVGWLIGMKKT